MARVITVLGGSGFVGRYLVHRLARTGAQIRIGVRNIEKANSLKPLGEVGQIVPLPVDLGRGIGLEAALSGADGVVNLVGILSPGGGNRSFESVHAEGAQRAAIAAKAEGAGRFLHLSALGADLQSRAQYARTKALGEAAVQAVYPDAAILRPSLIFGPEDQFFNRFAAMARWVPVLPVIGGGRTKFQPVYVGDVADALLAALQDPAARGIYELGGPSVYSFKELLRFILKTTRLSAVLAPIPFPLARALAFAVERLPLAPITRDQVESLKSDAIVSGQYPGLSALGIRAAPLEPIVAAYLARFQPGGRFACSLDA